MTAVHESADYTFRLICEAGWADEYIPYTYIYKLSITPHELPQFLLRFDGENGFDGELLARVIKDGGAYFIVQRDAYGTWNVDQYPTFAERDQVYNRLVKQNAVD